MVEDDPRLQTLARRVLESRGYQVRLAGDGEAAVVLAAAPEVAMVLMDVSLPGMDGLAATRRIRQIRGQDLPVVACTAHTMVGDRERVLAAGCNDFLSKPYTIAQLAEVVARHLG